MKFYKNKVFKTTGNAKNIFFNLYKSACLERFAN